MRASPLRAAEPLIGNVDIVQLAPCMGPAADGRVDAGRAAVVIKRVEPGIGIGLQKARKKREMFARSFSLAIGTVAEQRGRLVARAPSPVVTQIDP